MQNCKIVDYKIYRIIYETNVTAIYGDMICQLAVKLYGNLWRICFRDYIYKNYYYLPSHIDIAGK